jgi:arylsulfatase A-like enzyme
MRLCEIRRPGTKLFLHITNSQTHFPYETHSQPASDDVRIRYVQAIEEADFCLGRFLLALDDLIPLANTIKVYTADHGESLGERGYKAHSTAITREQINVPFAIHHPEMPHFEVPFSTHFDVFPTLFDFLGIHYDYPAIGSSLRLPNRTLNEVLFSETRHGATPSCYGHVGARAKLFFDVSLDRYQVLDWDDQIVKELSGAEQDRCRAMLLAALRTRGLVSAGKINGAEAVPA